MNLTGKLGDPAAVDGSLSDLARGVVGSEILRIAAEIRALKAKGAEICNLTVGDFDPAQFPIPAELLDGMRAALAAGQTNYPPSDGVLALREAVARYYAQRLGLTYPIESVLIAGGARPLLYGAYRTVLDPGDVTVYPVPSWNNNHYAYLVRRPRDRDPGARGDRTSSPPSTISPAPAERAPHPAQLAAQPDRHHDRSGRAAQDLRGDRRGEPPPRAGRRQGRSGSSSTRSTGSSRSAAKHVTPVELVPEVAPYTILLDALSKASRHGLRVGWGMMPPAVRRRMADILGHVGAWAPKAEQVARPRCSTTAPLRAYLGEMRPRVAERLDALQAGFAAMRREGLPVEVIAPQGAIYSRRSASRSPGRDATKRLRRLLLEGAGLAVVPFQAFGLRETAAGSGSPSARCRWRTSTPRCRGCARRSPAVERRQRQTFHRRHLHAGDVLRVGLFPFAENKHGDAPMRALIAERLVLEPASAAVPRTYCQFGPLHTTLMRPFIALDRDAPRSSRYLSLLCGLAVFFPFFAFARRLVGEAHAQLAAFLLAVSPMHLQASTTASSEALYLLLWVWAIERLLAALETRRRGTFAVAGLFASLAAVTRYDAWLALPMVAVAAGWPAAARSGVGRRAASLSSRWLPRSSRWPGSPGARRPAATRCSSPTTSRAITPGWRRRRPRVTARSWGGRGSSASGRWRSSPP